MIEVALHRTAIFCHDCGCLVRDYEVHANWHKKLERLMERVAALSSATG